MPTLHTMQLIKPKDWQEFETIARDAMAQKWSSPQLQKNGRSGQTQHGVDIYGLDYLGRPVGIQCKRYEKALTFKDVEEEIADAATFQGPLTALFLATTCDPDAKLQQRVRILSEGRAQSGDFAVGLLFWEDIVAGLVLNPAVFQNHYPQVSLPHIGAVDKERRLAALEVGFYGASLWEYVELMFGEFGWLAQSDPDELFATFQIIEHRARQLLPPKATSELVDPLYALDKELRSVPARAPDWSLVKVLSERVAKRCKLATSFLPINEHNALDIGLQLGTIYHHSDARPGNATRDMLKRKIDGLLGPGHQTEVDRVFSAADSIADGYRWALRIYNLTDREIRLG